MTAYSKFVRSTPTLSAKHVSTADSASIRMYALGVMCLGQEEIPQSETFSFRFELLHDRRNDLPSLLWIEGDLGMVDILCWDTLTIYKVYEASKLVLCVL